MKNNITIIGRLTKDPELRSTSTGKDMVNFSVAVDNYGKDAGTSFFNCKAFGQTATYANTYLSKGRLVSVGGRHESNKDSEGRTWWTLVASEVSGLDKPKDDAPEPGTTATEKPYNAWDDE